MNSYKEYKEELIDNAIKRDPALRSREEAALFSPGIRALLYHWSAHKLFIDGNLYEAMEIAYKSRMETGIEIHPGQK